MQFSFDDARVLFTHVTNCVCVRIQLRSFLYKLVENYKYLTCTTYYNYALSWMYIIISKKIVYNVNRNTFEIISAGSHLIFKSFNNAATSFDKYHILTAFGSPVNKLTI